MSGIRPYIPSYIPPGTQAVDSLQRGQQNQRVGSLYAAGSIAHVDIAKGVSEVSAQADVHGIPHKYVDAFADYAKQHDVVFVVRARNPFSRAFHASCHPVLPCGVRLRAARKLGPLTGLVPADDTFLTSAEKAQVDGLIKEGNAQPTPLSLTRARITELVNQGELTETDGAARGILRLQSNSQQNAQPGFFTAVEEPVGSGFYSIKHEGKPVQVLGENRGDRVLPYTDPIDMMAVSSSDRSATHAKQMNAALHRENTPVVQIRNAATHPYSDGADFFPCVVFGPSSMNIDGAAVAKDTKDLVRLFAMAAQAGHPLPVDPSWPADIKAVLRDTEHAGSAAPGARPTRSAPQPSAMQLRLLGQLGPERRRI